MTPEQRLLKQQKIEALQRAKAYLPDAGFVCIALSRAKAAAPHLEPAAKALQDYVLEQLKPFSALESWQNRDHFTAKVCRPKDRRDWIDWMINCLEEDLINGTV